MQDFIHGPDVDERGDYGYRMYRRRKVLDQMGRFLPAAAIPLLVIRFAIPAAFAERYATTLAVVTSTGVFLLVVAFAGQLLRYLQGNPTLYGREAEALEYISDRLNRFGDRISEIEQRNRDGVSPQRFEQELLPLEERTRVLSELQSRIETQVTKAVIESLRAQVEAEYRKELRHHDFEKEFGRTLQRLSAEVNALGRRGNLNLVIGIVTTVAGLALLGYFVILHAPAPTELTSFVLNFVPRLSLVIFVELFAFFFLRLYKSTLSEIKYFQNEMTNVEARAIALRAASEMGAPAEVIKNLSQTERNHIIEKGQTTVDLERTRLEGEHLSAVGKALVSVVRGSSEKGGA